MMRTLAAFDFDKTITDRHTFWRFLRQAAGPLRFAIVVISLFPTLLRLLSGMTTLLEAREVFIRRCLQGLLEVDLQRIADRFAREAIPRWVRSAAMARIRQHVAAGDRVVIVSNSAECYLAPWAASIGIREVLGTRFESRGGRLTGALLGDHCQGPEKVRRLRTLVGDLSSYDIEAYGDAEGDLDLLARAKHAHYRTFERGSDEGIEPSGDDPVIVVGAGPVGLVLACELARRGVKCRTIDRVLEPSNASKAFVIHARTLELLEQTGIVDRLLRLGLRVSELSIYAERKRSVTYDFGILDSRYPFILSLPQSVLERELTRRLEELGGQVERGVALETLTQDDRGATVTLRRVDGTMEEVRASWVAGCDGSHSTTRPLIGLPLEGETYDREFLIADGDLSGIAPTPTAHTFVSSGGYVMIFPLPGGQHRVVVDVPLQASGAPPPTLDDVHRRLAERGLRELRVANPIWLTRTAFHCRIVPTFRKERVFLAGDAAHIHSPLGGQGMNTGIHDAFDLGWRLALVARGEARPRLLDGYDDERRAAAHRVLKATDQQTRLLITDKPIVIALRNALAPLVTRMRAVQLKAGRQLSGIDVNYRARAEVERASLTPWCPEDRTPPAAGDRAPDVHLEDSTSLMSLFRGRHVLLLFPGRSGARDAVREVERDVRGLFGRLVDVHVVESSGAHDRYRAAGPLAVLVRPDGYVWLRTRPRSGRVLAFLALYLRPLRPSERIEDTASDDRVPAPVTPDRLQETMP